MPPQADAKVVNGHKEYKCPKCFNKASIGLKEYIVTVLIQKHVTLEQIKNLKITSKIPNA